MTDEFARFVLAFLGIVAVVVYLGRCTPLYGSPTRFQYDRRPLVVWGYWGATHYSNSRYWIKTVYAIK